MSRKNNSLNNQPTKSVRKNRGGGMTKRMSLPLRYRLLMLACGATLVVGFFFAARTHFASIDFSMRNSKLRKMSEELEADKRRLMLAKEIALSPAELKKAAQKIGFTAGKTTGVQPSSDKTEGTHPGKSEVVTKVKQTIIEKADEVVAEVKPTVKKLTEIKAPDLRARRETTQAER